MNWIRANKFLTGFIAVMVVACGGLGYLLYSAWGTYNDVTDQYTEQANSLHQLQTRVPFPNEENLAKYKEQRDAFIDATHSLATSLSTMVLPVEDLSPSGFQDRLRDTVAGVVTDAQKAGVTLPSTFAMDFDRYQSSPPPQEAAGPLGRELAGLKIVMEILISEHVDAVTSLSRAQLPEEGGAGAPGGGGFGGGGFGGGGGGFGGGGGRGGRGGGGGGGRRGGGGGGGGGGVQNFPFEIHFTASQPAFQKVLNDFAACKQQFFVTRTLLVQNTNPKPASKDATAAAAAATPTPAPDTTGTDTSGGAPAGPSLSLVVGNEKVDVGMRVDMVAFNPPEGSAPGGAPRTRASP